MTALADLERLAMDAAAPIPAIQALLAMDEDHHLPAIRELLGVVDGRLAQISDAVYQLKAAEKG